jgi:hypothetical protein
MIEDTTTPEVSEEVAETVAPPQGLSIQDLANLRNIVDVASQRGAFKTNEFTIVGATYTKLNDFINAVAPQMAATEDTPESGPVAEASADSDVTEEA